MNSSLIQQPNRRRSEAATLPEVVIAVVIIGTMMVALYAGFTAGFTVMKSAREGLRATQILVQRAEVIRLYSWSQIQNTNLYLKPSFIEYYDPSGLASGKAGVMYVGSVKTNGVAIGGTTYSNNMRGVTISVFWTNRIGKMDRTFSRQLETYVAKSGAQNYIYGK